MTVSLRSSRLGWLAPVLMGLALLRSGPAPGEEIKVTAADRARFTDIADSLDEERLRTYVEELVKLGTRVTGYPGCDQAAIYVREQLERLGVQDVHYEDFFVTVPVDNGANIEVIDKTTRKPLGEPIRLQPLWPNLVRTSQLPPAGLEGHLIYAGQSRLADYDGQDVENGVTLVDFNCGSQWFNAPFLGAKAVIFIEPEETVRGEVEAKFSSIPVDMPRFYISRRHADHLLTLIESNPDLTVRLRCNMPWMQRPARNIVATIPGTDPQLANQTVLIEAYYDSMSVVPGQAPGAESALGVATLLELARLLVANPPGRTVRLLCTAGHFEALSGTRHYLDRHFQSLSDGSDVISLFSSLDIGSKRQGVGMFYKGHFLNQREEVRQRFADLGRVCRERSEAIAECLGESP
ncbi:MAG: M28 family peptidase [Armatimonadetes bacterium]|nr:M28 family peptidase [Armatimonadota bacterium]